MMDSRNFLVPDATFVIEIIAFAAVMVVMTRYVLPRIRGTMQARERAITESLTAAQQAEQRQHAAEAEADAVRGAARREARLIVDRARSTGEQMIREGRQAGVAEYRWLAGRAGRELQRRTALSSQRLRLQARAAAVAAAAAYLGDDVDAAQLDQLVDDHFEALSNPRVASRREPSAA